MPARPDDWMVEVELVEDVEVELVEDDGPSMLVPPSDRAASDQEPALTAPDAPAAHRRELPRRARQVVGGLAALPEGVWYDAKGGQVVEFDGTRGESEVTSLGLLDGQVKWTAEVEGLRVDAGGLSDAAVVIVMAAKGRSWVLAAFAVATGERLWFADAPGTPDLNELFFAGSPPRLELIDDRPVVRSGNALTWLG